MRELLLPVLVATLAYSGLVAAAMPDDAPATSAAAPAVDSAPDLPVREEPLTGLADSAGLRATIFGPAREDLAPVPESVPLAEINVRLPWARPVPKVYWFDRRLRVWFSEQRSPAPLAVVIAGTGADGNSAKIAVLRAALYGAGYHVLTLPSPTFPGFIAAASSTGVAGDLRQDSQDLYATLQFILARLPRRVQTTDIDVVGYSLGGAHAAMIRSLDATAGRLHIHRVVMINPPVNLFGSMSRLDRLFVQSIGASDAALDRLYRRLYARLANYYRAADKVRVEDTDLLAAAGSVLHTDADYAAAIALTFRLALVEVFFAGDLYARTGAVLDPEHPPQPGDSLEQIERRLRTLPLSEYVHKVFEPFYLARRPPMPPAELLADSRLQIIGEQLHQDGDYFVQTNRDDLILDASELQWLRDTFGSRIVVYDHGGHLGTIGEKQQVADMLDMLAGRWQGPQQ